MAKGLRGIVAAVSFIAGEAFAQFCPGASPWVFDDVASSHPFCPAISWVAHRGITLGCSVIDADHRLFCPNLNVTRGEMAAFMFRLGSQNAFIQGGNVFSPTARLGATNTAPLELIVGNRRALRLEPSTISPNVVGGNPSNFVLEGVRGATIGGGGVTPGNTDPDYDFEDVSRITDHYGTIGGGYANWVGDAAGTEEDQPFGTVAGGAFNRATAAYATVAGGGANYATNSYAFVGGGEGGQATGQHATIAGGHTNRASGPWSSVGGGGGTGANCPDPPSGLTNRLCGNQAAGQASTIGGGAANYASHYGTVGGGYANTAGGDFSTVAGGFGNVASGNSSFAAGRHAHAVHEGAFVWNGALAAVSSTGSGQFTVNAPGGVRMLVASGNCTLTNGSSGWQCASDRALKADIVTVDGAQILDRVAALPIARWSFSDVPGVMHMGPMAQEFHAAFALGDDPTRLAPMDVQGVALAAIQGLNAKLGASERELARVKSQLAEVTGLLVELSARLDAVKAQR